MRGFIFSPLLGALFYSLLGSVTSYLLPYGSQTGDETIPFSFTSSNAIALTVPVPYYEEPQAELFISSNGAVSFEKPLPQNLINLESNAVSAIAVFYAAANNGVTYYRSEPPTSTLSLRMAEEIQRTFSNVADFQPKIVLVITWDRLTTPDSPGENAFQLVILSDARTSYALLRFDRIEWTKAKGQHAQSGFYFKDGRNQNNVHTGSESISELVRMTNRNEEGSFIFRISDSFTVDPKDIVEKDDDYDYASVPEYDTDLNSEKNANGGCPPNPYKDNCPRHCEEIRDDNQCVLCICPNNQESAQQHVNNNLHVESNLPNSEPLDNDKPQHPSNGHPETAFDLPKELESTDLNNEELPAYQSPHDSHLDNSAIPESVERDEVVHVDQNQPITNAARPLDGTCASVASSLIPACNRYAICQDFKTGFCCHCSAEYIGNGLDCIKINDPVRIVGTFEGAINGKSIEKSDFYAFAQTKDGQQHTGIARVPANIAPSLLYLDSIGNIVGWLFATQASENAYNGFDLTSGVFNRSVSIHLANRFSLLIKQTFLGRKEDQDFITANVFVSGTLPDINLDDHIEYDNFVDTYHREQSGLLRAYTEREIKVRSGETEQKLRVTVDQQIHFTECKHNLQDKSQTLKIRVSRASAQFDKEQNVVRFASQNAAVDPNDELAGPEQRGPLPQNTRLNVEQGVCATGAHFCTENNMLCEPVENSYRCICEPGYQPQNDESVHLKFRCVLVPQNEDTLQPALVETPIGPGFCTSHSECHEWGECVFGSNGKAGKCKCRGWYVGDGVTDCGPPKPEKPPKPQYPQHAEVAPVVGTVCRSHGECSEHGSCVYSSTLNYYTCECVAPYRGDGIICQADSEHQPQIKEEPSSIESQDAIVRLPPTSTECHDQTECHVNAHCLKADSTERYFCECLDGYTGDGVQQCTPSDRCAPSVVGSCPPFAECTYGAIEQSYVCKCIQGYTGDGQVCHNAMPVVPNDCVRDPSQCHANAQCEFDLKSARYECRCKPGSTGDGYRICVLDSGCFENRNVCDQNAQCLPADNGQHVCNCNFGFHGTADAEKQPDKLLLGRGMSVIQRSTAPEVMGRQLVVVPHQVVVDLDYDCISDRIYWSDISGHAIRSATINGTDVTTYLVTDLKSPEGIAIDWSSRNLYYVDSGKNAHIGVASLDGRFRRTLLKEGLKNPRALEIDLVEGKLYYSDWHRKNPFIGRIDLDGRNNEVFVNSDVHLPNGLVIIQSTRELCWIDAGSQRLNCIGLQTRIRRLVYSAIEYPFGLAVRNDERFYWTDWKDHHIHTISINGQGYTSFPPTMGGGGKLYGIISLPNKCIGEPTPCALNNGGCDYLCLPSTHESVDCVCPDNTLGLDGC